MQKFATTAPITTVLDIPAGRLQLIAADRADATVEIRPANAGKSRDVKAAERVQVAFADGVLRIQASEADNKMFGPSGAVEVTVQLPAGSRVEAKGAAAELRGVGRLGDVVLEAAQGPVKLDETASAEISVQDGDITIGLLGGPARLRTLRGDVKVNQAVCGTVELRTEKGDIAIGAARGASATLDAGTGYGRVANALQNAKGADADLNIRATTSYGDIDARSI